MKVLFFLLLMASATIALGQQDTLSPAYQRYPALPGLQLLRIDSSRYTNDDLPKKKQVLLMLFSPDCSHCQQEAEQVVANQAALKDLHVLMVSTYPLFRLKEFGEKYGVGNMSNVVIAKDPYYILPSFYAIRNLPYLALYDKKGKLIKTFEGSVQIDKVLQAFDAPR